MNDSPDPFQAPSLPHTYEAVERHLDNVITAKVKTALLDDKMTRALEIHVGTLKGAVELSGFVKTGADKKRAAEIASSVNGVKSVVNGIVVRANA